MHSEMGMNAEEPKYFVRAVTFLRDYTHILEISILIQNNAKRKLDKRNI
jgi:hypothetical protein